MGRRMSTANEVPETRGELEGDEALETLRRTGRRRLAVDAVQRLRAADGFSHARALAFQLTLTLIPALIALVGLGAAADEDAVRDVVEEALRTLAPGAAGDLLTEALDQGAGAARDGAGLVALIGGMAAALLAGTLGMAQIERSANRIYGIERDRPPVRRYGLALALACTAGALVIGALLVLVGGEALADALDSGDGARAAWGALRWPVALILVTGAVALLFERVPRRRQPEASWLAFGAGLAVALWLCMTGALALALELTDDFGATYGPLAGIIAVLLWAFLTSVALLLGLAFAAQLEAVRAGVPAPRVERDADVPQPAPAGRSR